MRSTDKRYLLVPLAIVLAGFAAYLFVRTRVLDSDAKAPASRPEEPADAHVFAGSATRAPESITPPPEPHSEQRLILEVQTEDQVPIPGARCMLRRNEAWTIVGLTDVHGQCAIDLSAEGGPDAVGAGDLLLSVACEPYIAAVELISAPLPETHMVVLRPGKELGGNVTWGHWSGPLNVPSGTRVLAWPSNSALEVEDIAPSECLGPYIRTAITDVAGAFVLEGLDPETRYSVCASGPGLLTTQYAVAVSPEDSPRLKICVDQMFGHIVRLADQGGHPLQAPPGSYGPKGAKFLLDPQENDAAFVFPTVLEQRLAGIDPSAMGLDDWSQRLLLYIGSPTREEISLLRFTADLPGYEFVDVTFSAKRLDLGLQETRVVVLPVASSFGTVYVRVASAQGSLHSQGQRGPAGIVTMYSVDGATFDYPLKDIRADVYRLDGVPAGAYRVGVALSNGFVNEEAYCPDGLAQVDQAHSPIVDVDLSLLGGINCLITDPGGKSYDSRATFRVEPRNTPYSSGHPVHFDCGPYELRGFPSGEYQLIWSTPNQAGEGVSGSADVIVTPGAVAIAAIELRRAN